LFGSQARGDARIDSDWDILIILDKEKLEPEDYDKVSFPLTMLGWDLGARINPIMSGTKVQRTTLVRKMPLLARSSIQATWPSKS
jgi:UTP:GlnB (protein PII) uridylyltransferase